MFRHSAKRSISVVTSMNPMQLCFSPPIELQYDGLVQPHCRPHPVHRRHRLLHRPPRRLQRLVLLHRRPQGQSAGPTLLAAPIGYARRGLPERHASLRQCCHRPLRTQGPPVVLHVRRRHRCRQRLGCPRGENRLVCRLRPQPFHWRHDQFRCARVLGSGTRETPMEVGDNTILLAVAYFLQPEYFLQIRSLSTHTHSRPMYLTLGFFRRRANTGASSRGVSAVVV
jgi:hypothetical protein